MLDTVVDHQPAMVRLTRSKAEIVSSLFERHGFTSKVLLLRRNNAFRISSPHRRSCSDLNAVTTSLQDYPLLSGERSVAEQKIYLDTKAANTEVGLSFPPRANSALGESQLSTDPKTALSSENFNSLVKNSSSYMPHLEASKAPTVRCPPKDPGSTARVLSVQTSTLTTVETRRKRPLETPEKNAVNSDETKRLRINSIMSIPSDMQFSTNGTSPTETDVEDGLDTSLLALDFSPPSFIRPLGRRLLARREPPPFFHKSSLDSPKREISVLSTTADNGDEGVAMNGSVDEQDKILMETRIAEQDKFTVPDDLAEHDPMAKQDKMVEEDRNRIAEDNISLKIAHQLDSIAETASQDDDSTPEWRIYMEYYSKGNFNITSPPQPPPLSPTLQFLPSILPRSEARRALVYKALGPSWNKLTIDRLREILTSVLLDFEVGCGAISFFTTKNECIKAERGYNLNRISRPTSIAAHALLSADVFVIPDTEKDWRFQGNPLVTGDPQIRFFAGAPLLAGDGQPIGILSIFSSMCRTSFGPFERRKLADFATLVMKDLTTQLDNSKTLSTLSAPKLERNLVINDYQHSNLRTSLVRSDQVDEHDLSLIPPALRCHKSKSPPSRHSREFVNGMTNHDPSLQQNHSTSAGSNDGNLDSQGEFERNANELSGDFNVDALISFHKLDTLNIREFEAPSPRPFSSSDVSSIHQHPTNTPVHSQIGSPTGTRLDISLEHFRLVSGGGYSENAHYAQLSGWHDSTVPRSPFQDLSPRTKTSISPAPFASPHPPSSPTTILPAFVENSDNTVAINHKAFRDDARAQAALICSRTAQRLGYDLIYAAELNPSLDAIDETHILEPGVLPMRILAAYGMTEPLRLSPQLHIDTLRCKGFYHWQAPPNLKDGPGKYQSGCLISIPTQGGVRRLRTSGIIIGAFKEAQPIHYDAVETTNANLQLLVDAGYEVKRLLWIDPSSPLRRLSSQSDTDAFTEPYPAKEAVQIWERSHSPYPHDRYREKRRRHARHTQEPFFD